MGDITLEENIGKILKKLSGIDERLKDIEESNSKLKEELKEEMKDLNSNLEKELKEEMKDLNSNLEKELKNTNYKIEMLQSTSGNVNTFLDALSPAAAVGSKYHKTNSYYSE